MDPVTEHVVYLEHIEAFPALCKQALLTADGDAERIDVLTYIKSSEQQLGKLRRSNEAELDYGITEGETTQVEIGRRAVRSYNTSKLLLMFMTHLDEGFINTLGWLRNHGVVTVNWNWTPLQRATERLGIGLSIAKEEIEDGDPKWDVGEVWKNASASYSFKEE